MSLCIQQYMHVVVSEQSKCKILIKSSGLYNKQTYSQSQPHTAKRELDYIRPINCPQFDDWVYIKPRDHCNTQRCFWWHKRMKEWLQCEVRHTCTCFPSRFDGFLGWRLRKLGREAAAPEAAYTAWGYVCICPLQHVHNRRHNDRMFVRSLIVCSCFEPFKSYKASKLTILENSQKRNINYFAWRGTPLEQPPSNLTYLESPLRGKYGKKTRLMRNATT